MRPFWLIRLTFLFFSCLFFLSPSLYDFHFTSSSTLVILSAPVMAMNTKQAAGRIPELFPPDSQLVLEASELGTSIEVSVAQPYLMALFNDGKHGLEHHRTSLACVLAVCLYSQAPYKSSNWTLLHARGRDWWLQHFSRQAMVSRTQNCLANPETCNDALYEVYLIRKIWHTIAKELPVDMKHYFTFVAGHSAVQHFKLLHATVRIAIREDQLSPTALFNSSQDEDLIKSLGSVPNDSQIPKEGLLEYSRTVAFNSHLVYSRSYLVSSLDNYHTHALNTN